MNVSPREMGRSKPRFDPLVYGTSEVQEFSEESVAGLDAPLIDRGVSAGCRHDVPSGRRHPRPGERGRPRPSGREEGRLVKTAPAVPGPLRAVSVVSLQ